MSNKIVVDRVKNLSFENEDEILQHFSTEITTLEEEYRHLKSDGDDAEEKITNFEEMLGAVFEDPDEIWRDDARFDETIVYTYIRHLADRGCYYIALTYMDEDAPTFIFLHFATSDENLVNHYRRVESIYNREQMLSESDALSEGDELAIGLHKAMITIRSDSDIPGDEFADYVSLRDETVQDADEIWRSTDLQGNVLVSFIKAFEIEGENDVTYITVTKEDSVSETHFVLFSFPTRDSTLVDRYRHGEMLNSDEVVQEESH